MLSDRAFPLYLGLDFGTSGARACVADASGEVVYRDSIAFPDADTQTPLVWREALHGLIHNLPDTCAARLRGIAIAATSASVLLCDEELEPTSPALLYGDGRAMKEAEWLKQQGPSGHIACSPTSGLAKFLWLCAHTDPAASHYFMHQADWLAALLAGTGGTSDYHNALKTGYDAENLCWPEWVRQLPHAHLLPQVVAPGTRLAPVAPVIAGHFGLSADCIVRAGTTDSIASFIAAGLHEPGQALTSLGTTLVLKLLSTKRIEAAEYGVYSHRYGDLWLAGGASNAGGGVLRHYFSDAQLAELSMHIDPASDSPLDYYPLLRPGERFPVSDPEWPPCLTPRPDDEVKFLHGLLQGLGRIEADGYARLSELGADPMKSVSTAGGGAVNLTWMSMRARMLGVSVNAAAHADAAYGAARLASGSGIGS